MASLMDNLVEVLEIENAKYGELIELSKAKKQSIIKGDIRELEQITEKEQVVADFLQNMDRKRNSVLKDMADVLGRDFNEMTITKLIGYMEQQPKEQNRLIEIREKLLETGKEMQRWNKRNEELLQQALEMVEFDLTLFKSLRQAPETANYNRNAYNTGTLLGGGGFDAKQ